MGKFRQKRSLFGIFTLGLTVFGGFEGAIAQDFNTSIGDNGIQATILHREPYDLLGRKIAIGQVEIGRPGKFGLDKRAVWQPQLGLSQLFFLNEKATPDDHVDDHAGMVAGIMVGQDKRQLGVAPEARLFSSAIGSTDDSAQPEECLATQHIARQNGGDVRAINFSFGESLSRDPRPNPALDGNALLTQCLDWTARVYDVLHVVAGNQGTGGIPIPTDHYNGITTAYTTRFQGDTFNKIDFANLSSLPVGSGSRLIRQEINTGSRRAISLSAPGSQLNLITTFNKIDRVSGTSFAAPHITGTVALLQEFSDRQLKTQADPWSLAARRHEVMKAVLLNSADKIADTGDGKSLEMTRTILSKQNRTWLEGDAYKNPDIPLDIEMGTGQLNAQRAYQQLAAGQWSTTAPVPSRGWNYDKISAQEFQDYHFAMPLQRDSFVALTLTWDRWVDLNDQNNNGLYDVGESFTDRGLNDLNLYLLPADADNLGDAVCRSTSPVDSVEHIFCPVSQTGKYKVRVVYAEQANQASQDYAIAWWTATTP
ncbi:S8 family serine peptidase [Picosynechococcus sp. PCC 73109]|uniref:S8 family serine peptidase n=1 Tax=Picosynechococcus sp. PCC 73109 TaxID=374982 RepID=UPI0007457DA6|nr:S8 family serine peptidase [Picosynechococcus sp. PCC 73109]AMA08721.1 peptidase S8 and S53 subtilisin kexin sedolisin [Picosynechococcus sp. PCC 73109]